jgi:hypothetical protein
MDSRPRKKRAITALRIHCRPPCILRYCYIVRLPFNLARYECENEKWCMILRGRHTRIFSARVIYHFLRAQKAHCFISADLVYRSR